MSASIDRELGQWALPGAALGLDMGGTIRVPSGLAAELLGAAEDHLLGRPITEFIPTLPLRYDTAGYNLAYVRLWYANGARRQVSGVRFDGRALPLEISIAIPGENKSVTFVLSMRPVQRDRESSERLSRLHETLRNDPQAAVVTTVQGVIEYVNPAFEMLTGFTREEAVGKTPAILKSGVHDAQFYAKLWATLHAGRQYRGILVNRRKNGQRFNEKVIIRPFVDAGGTITHFVSMGVDATESVEAAQRVLKCESLAAQKQPPGLQSGASGAAH